MLALCLMLSVTYYAQNYAGIISWSLVINIFDNYDQSLLAIAWPMDFNCDL